MSIEPQKNPSALAPLAQLYEPTDEDAARVLSKLRAALATTRAPGTPSSAPPTATGATGMHGVKKAFIVGLSCLTLAFVAAAVIESTRAPSPEATIAPAASVAVVTPLPLPEPTPAVESATAIPSVSVDALPSAVAGSARPSAEPKPAKPATASSRPVAADTLEKEARLLAAARRALAEGDGDRALALLDGHAREFPDGWLASDRTAERVVVLCHLGRKADAVREAHAFLQGRPKSPLTHRVETSCAGEQ